MCYSQCWYHCKILYCMLLLTHEVPLNCHFYRSLKVSLMVNIFLPGTNLFRFKCPCSNSDEIGLHRDGLVKVEHLFSIYHILGLICLLPSQICINIIFISFIFFNMILLSIKIKQKLLPKEFYVYC